MRSLTFHSLRHSFNSEMASAGVGEELRMKLTGHATREQNKKYTHHELELLRAAMACARWKVGCASFGALAAISGDSQKSLSAFAT